ncbi:NADH dehydrogenase (quinone), G subunit [Pneumocystis carinii B80]|uniref:NADH-ubiquinone oxidoreductase 78 kDa subunit, mitochondrial n=1 Tax=Pneumocystis carinii (strain B80) TaxID=1408658 RepID=A0A0W4ZCJ5_PNEC8|nr:NADH dehydrogenase (quinone), G subunit [Pneumocystis carinii B80]KTW26144.1 NADH dehydrogenase (quinone), G subunit [Pneumocystis carinii B80]
MFIARHWNKYIRNDISSFIFSRTFFMNRIIREEVEIEIDGKPIMIEQGSALIQACEKAGIQIPRFCYHERLQVAGNCRMCLVEVEKTPKPVASCAIPVLPGMKVKTNSQMVHKAREGVMEFLLANHPLDCPICDQGGECDLQDQSMRYGTDRGRFYEYTGKRAVEDKDLGPLIKTAMTRCIHCTRCVRFVNELAGAAELGTTGRGSDMQIGTYLKNHLNSELSGNIIDLCPVGALTSKPYAFRARPWELKRTDSIDIHDAVGSSISINSRGLEIMRILPRLNDDVNEEWINDKTRFANDGLKVQRLQVPLIRRNDKFVPATWDQALSEISSAYKRISPIGDEFKAISGHLVDAESLICLKDLANRLGSENLALDQPEGDKPLPHGVDIRTNYLFNSTIRGIEQAGFILLVGTNPRHEAAVLNSRIRKSWLRSNNIEIAMVGENSSTTYDYIYIGHNAIALKKALDGGIGKKLREAERPMIIIGSAVAEQPDARFIYETIGKFVVKNKDKFLTPEWNGYNVLQRAASRNAAYDIGFVTFSPETAKVKPKFIYLLGADELSAKDIPKDSFVVYQGHHGDLGAQYADVILPSFAYTEQSGTYVNVEGRAQMTRPAINSLGVARENWKIIRALSEYLNVTLPYDDIHGVRNRLNQIAPSLTRYNVIEFCSMPDLGMKVQIHDHNKGSEASGHTLVNPITDFYLTDVISRNSKTMAKCSLHFSKKVSEEKSIQKTLYSFSTAHILIQKKQHPSTRSYT